jgi:hypothetical protein
VLPVDGDGISLTIRATQRRDTEVETLQFVIAPRVGDESAIRHIATDVALFVGVNELEFHWDGRDDARQRAAPGTYRLSAAARTSSSRELRCRDGTTVVERFEDSLEGYGLGLFDVP